MCDCPWQALGPIFSCATRSQAADMVQAVKDVLGDEHILPWDVSRAMSMEERSAFAPVFSSLLQLIRASKSSAVLPLIEEHLLKVFCTSFDMKLIRYFSPLLFVYWSEDWPFTSIRECKLILMRTVCAQGFGKAPSERRHLEHHR